MYSAGMKKIASSQFQRYLGEVLLDVARGEVYAVTQRGRVVGVLTAPPADLDLSGVEQSPIGLKPEKAAE